MSAIRIEGVSKFFGPIRANDNASLEVQTGEIHALVGENGAGKSTLMRILAGLLQPDSGKIEVKGVDATGWSTSDAIKAGIGMVHQHFMLVPTLTVTENIVLGMEPTRNGTIDYAGAVRGVEALCRETGLVIDPNKKVSDLSVGEAQRVEILKTLYRGAKILILDEPTAVLSPPEVVELWRVLRKLRDNGGTVVLITHRLDEVMEISDIITVMRAGTTIERIKTAGTSPSQIARAMVGREVLLSAHRRTVRPSMAGSAIIEVRDLVVGGHRKAREVDGVSFTIAAGEILGIAGVEGNGQTELIEALAGLRPVESGTITINGADITRDSVRERRAAGLTHIPEDRHRRALIMDYSVADNLILGDHSEYSRNGILDFDRIGAKADGSVKQFDIRPPQPELPARSLSGGNQQKIVIAREMGREFSVLLASQPTRGVDVGAIEFIHEQLLLARSQGKAVLLVSAELNEVLALADRVAVMFRGKFATVLPIADATQEVLGEYMVGTRSASAA
jgi:general nucleoside transport system ATP-binding protein